jgi:hypothetical protein
MDFSKLNETEHANRGAELTGILAPDGETVLPGVSIRLLGANSTVGRAAMSLIRKNMTMKSLQTLSIDDQHKMTTDRLVALTVSWTGIDMNGKEYKCTPENVRALYSNRDYEWLRLQVINFVDSPKNFFDAANIS